MGNALKNLDELYKFSNVEMVDIVSCALSVSLSAKFDREAKPRRLGLPAGNYLIIRLTNTPLDKVGLFALVAPEPADEVLGGSSRGQNESTASG